MDNTMAVKSARPWAILFSLSALSVSFWTSPASAEDFLCDAKQASSQQLPVLDESCPIGQGLWGKQQPKNNASLFWIQCGLLNQPLSLTQAKRLYKHISTDVWMKPEGKDFRCLVGPYKDFQEAQRDLNALRGERGYKEAFIREVIPGAANALSMAKPVVKPAAPAPKPAAKPTQTTTKLNPPAAAKPLAVAAPNEIQSVSSKPANAPEIDIRLKGTVSGVDYAVPYILHSEHQFYMEHGTAWNRLNYDDALSVCRQLGMKLPTEVEWSRLLNSDVLVKETWPIHLPYWGNDRHGLFTSGKITKLKGTSLLNIMCTK